MYGALRSRSSRQCVSTNELNPVSYGFITKACGPSPPTTQILGHNILHAGFNVETSKTSVYTCVEVMCGDQDYFFSCMSLNPSVYIPVDTESLNRWNIC